MSGVIAHAPFAALTEPFGPASDPVVAFAPLHLRGSVASGQESWEGACDDESEDGLARSLGQIVGTIGCGPPKSVMSLVHVV